MSRNAELSAHANLLQLKIAFELSLMTDWLSWLDESDDTSYLILSILSYMCILYRTQWLCLHVFIIYWQFCVICVCTLVEFSVFEQYRDLWFWWKNSRLSERHEQILNSSIRAQRLTLWKELHSMILKFFDWSLQQSCYCIYLRRSRCIAHWYRYAMNSYLSNLLWNHLIVERLCYIYETVSTW